MTVWHDQKMTAQPHVTAHTVAGKACRVCGEPATHRVVEDTWQVRPAFQAVLCCEHFDLVMGADARAWCEGSNWITPLGRIAAT